MLDRVADLTWRRPKLVLAAVALFMAAGAAFGGNVEEHLKAAGFTDPDSESDRALALLREELGYDADPGLIVLVRAKGGGRLEITDPEIRHEVGRLSVKLGKARHVGRVVNPLRALGRAEKQAAGIPERPTLGELARKTRRRSPLIADDGRSLVIAGHLDAQDQEEAGGDAADDAKELVSSKLVDVSITGFAPGFSEVESQTREDLQKAELIAFPALAVLLLLVFRGVVAAALPLLVGGASILGTFLGLRIMSELTDTSLFALNIATALSLGLAVDYGLLMISRYREELERDGPTREAHRRVVNTAGKTVLFSGFTVAVALLALLVFPQRFLYSVGAAGAMVGAISSIVALLTLSAAFALLGERINSLAIRRGSRISDTSGGWHRLAKGVMRRPVTVALASSALMLAAASPVLWTELTGPSAEAVPPSQPSFEPNEYMQDHYSRIVIQPVTVTVDGEAPARRLARFNQRILRLDGLSDSSEFVRSNGISYATFATRGKPLGNEPQDAVRAIRELEPPAAGAAVLVSGNTARFIDQKQSLIDHVPLVIAIVGLTTFALLFLLTGSILLPLKTLLMNALTLAAVLGVLVLGFQEGWLEVPLDYTGPAAIEVISIAFLFAISFGLATDYAVLVMARIKEHYDRGMSNEEAVATGIGRTGRVISAAAVMLAVVFIAFATSEIFFMKQVAIGQAAAVLIDATIVRALLVPSLMRLFGEWNWWAPAPMKRFQERFGFRE